MEEACAAAPAEGPVGARRGCRPGAHAACPQGNVALRSGGAARRVPAKRFQSAETGGEGAAEAGCGAVGPAAVRARRACGLLPVAGHGPRPGEIPSASSVRTRFAGIRQP